MLLALLLPCALLLLNGDWLTDVELRLLAPRMAAAAAAAAAASTGALVGTNALSVDTLVSPVDLSAVYEHVLMRPSLVTPVGRSLGCVALVGRSVPATAATPAAVPSGSVLFGPVDMLRDWPLLLL